MIGDIAALSKARRAKLSAEWTIETPKLKAARKAGRALGAYDDTRCLWCFPKFQFRDAELIYEMPEILEILRLTKHLGSSGWSEIEWFLSPHTLLGGLAPSDVLAPDPSAVITAARIEFLEDDSSDDL